MTFDHIRRAGSLGASSGLWSSSGPRAAASTIPIPDTKPNTRTCDELGDIVPWIVTGSLLPDAASYSDAGAHGVRNGRLRFVRPVAVSAPPRRGWMSDAASA
jgi:hypothetical protein